MVLNIQFQVAGIVLVVLIMALLHKEKTLRLYTEGIFSILLGTVFFCIFLDISSIFALNYEQKIGHGLMVAVCKAYLISIVCVAFMILVYTLPEIYKKQRHRERVVCLHAIPLATDVILVIVLPIYKYLEAGEIYTYGASVQVTYFFALLYLVDGLYHTVRYRNRIGKKRRESVWFLFAAFIITAIVQMFHNELLLVGFALAVAMVFMYTKLENPESNLDKITDTFNAYAYYGYLSKLLSMEKDFGMIGISIEGFRFIHENFGIRNGNVILKQIADFLSGLEGAVVFRDSETEFILIFENKLLVDNAAEHIRKRFEEPWNIREINFNLQVYMTYLPSRHIVNSTDEITEVLHYFMLECKKRGKNAVIRIDSEEISRKNNATDVEKVLRWALENDKVEVYYQPIYSIKDGKFVSMEALVRLFDQEGNFMMPDLFIPIAEQNGMILELGMAVFRKVCNFIKSTPLENYGIEYVEVNLSVIQCMQDDLSKQLLEIMAQYEVPPYRLNFEITETAAANSESTLLHNMQEILKVGGTFSLDDYGSGYSNLSYIVGFPFHIIKLDKNMVWSYFKSEKAEIAMKYAVSMVKELGMQILAEGVEDEKQYGAMKELGIDFIQGFYFSKPLPEREVTDFFAKWL